MSHSLYFEQTYFWCRTLLVFFFLIFKIVAIYRLNHLATSSQIFKIVICFSQKEEGPRLSNGTCKSSSSEMLGSYLYFCAVLSACQEAELPLDIPKFT